MDEIPLSGHNQYAHVAEGIVTECCEYLDHPTEAALERLERHLYVALCGLGRPEEWSIPYDEHQPTETA